MFFFKHPCLTHQRKILMRHLGINSIRYEVDQTNDMGAKEIDILIMLETKTDYSFPISRFSMKGICPPTTILDKIFGVK